MRLLTAAAALLTAASVRAAGLPSCEEDTAAHCLGEDADFSPDGITACLAGLGEARTDSCSTFLSLLEACSEEIQSGGLCGSDYANGDGVPCLVQRTKPEQLSAHCAAALPKQEAAAASLADTFWNDGKRFLDDDEVGTLSEDDLDTYQRWVKRKKKSGGRNKDREFAIKAKKKAKASQMIKFKAAGAATKALEGGSTEKEAKKAAGKVVKAEAKKAAQEDSTLEKFSKDEMKEIAIAAVKDAQEEIKQAGKRAKAEL